MTSAQLKIFNEEGEKEYNFSDTKVLSENEWIKKLVNKNIYLIEYGDKWKKLEEITQEDIKEIDNAQRDRLYFLGKKKYGRRRWEEKIMDLDAYIIGEQPECDIENYDMNDLYDLLDLDKDEILTLSIVDAKQVIKNAVDKMVVALEQSSNGNNNNISMVFTGNRHFKH